MFCKCVGVGGGYVHMSELLTESRRWCLISWIWSYRSLWTASHGHWETNPSPKQEQCFLTTTEPPLQPHVFIFFQVMFLISLAPSPLTMDYLVVGFVSGLQGPSFNWYIYTTNSSNHWCVRTWAYHFNLWLSVVIATGLTYMRSKTPTRFSTTLLLHSQGTSLWLLPFFISGVLLTVSYVKI